MVFHLETWHNDFNVNFYKVNCMPERIYIGNACYSIRLCDKLHDKISFKFKFYIVHSMPHKGSLYLSIWMTISYQSQSSFYFFGSAKLTLQTYCYLTKFIPISKLQTDSDKPCKYVCTVYIYNICNEMGNISPFSLISI